MAGQEVHGPTLAGNRFGGLYPVPHVPYPGIAQERAPMRPMEVDVLYVGAAQIECPECGARTKLNGDKLRGVDVTCANCKTSLYVAEDADIELSEDELLDADSCEG